MIAVIQTLESGGGARIREHRVTYLASLGSLQSVQGEQISKSGVTNYPVIMMSSGLETSRKCHSELDIDYNDSGKILYT